MDEAGFAAGVTMRPGARRKMPRPARITPYRGEGFGGGRAPTILMMRSSLGGNVRTEHTLTDDHFAMITIEVEHWDRAATATLPPFDLAFNAIGEADSNLSSLEAAISLLQFVPVSVPVLNRPEIVLGTGRCDIAGRLSGLADVIVPATGMIWRDSLAGLDPVAALTDLGLRLPVLIRPPGYHSGQHFHKIDSARDVQASLRDGAFNGFLATDYIDYRNGDGLFRKYRALFIDGVVYPYHLAISDHWKIHYFSALMAGHDANKLEERRFLEDMTAVIGARAVAALANIAQRMGLDYCGIDFSLTPAGEVIVFETNATMLIHAEEEAQEFAYRHRHVAGLIAAFRAMFRKRAGFAEAVN